MNVKSIFLLMTLALFVASCGPANPLDDLTGDILVVSNEGARIWLNNNNVGTVDASGELLVQNVRAGTHTVRARLDGYMEKLSQVTVIPQETSRISMSFFVQSKCNMQAGLSCEANGIEIIEDQILKTKITLQNGLGRGINISNIELQSMYDGSCKLQMDSQFVGALQNGEHIYVELMNECGSNPSIIQNIKNELFTILVTYSYSDVSGGLVQQIEGDVIFSTFEIKNLPSDQMIVCTGIECEYVYEMNNPILFFYPGKVGKVFYRDGVPAELFESEILYYGATSDGVMLTLFGQSRQIGFNEDLSYYANNNDGLRVRLISDLPDSTLDRLGISFWPASPQTDSPIPTTGMLNVLVIENGSENIPVSDAFVVLYNELTIEQGHTSEYGRSSFSLNPGVWTYDISKLGYENTTGQYMVTAGGDSTLTVYLAESMPLPVLPTTTIMTLRSNVLGTTFRTSPQTSTCVANQYDGSSNHYVCNITVTPGRTYAVTASVAGWHNITKNVEVDTITYSLTSDFMLIQQTGTALFHVRNETLSGNALQGIKIRVQDSRGLDTNATTNSSGSWRFNLPIGTYYYELRAAEHHFVSGTFTINTDQTVSINKAYVVPSYHLRIRLSMYQAWGGTTNQFREFNGRLMPGQSRTHTGYYTTAIGNSCAAIVRVTMQNNGIGVQCVTTDSWGSCNYKDVDNQARDGVQPCFLTASLGSKVPLAPPVPA